MAPDHPCANDGLATTIPAAVLGLTAARTEPYIRAASATPMRPNRRGRGFAARGAE